jgi:hypothetical protein
MSLSFSSANKISLKLGYPGQLQGVAIEDQRNNPTLITALKKQRKLR